VKKKKKLKNNLNVLVDDKMYINLKIITDRYQINISDYVRESISDKLNKENNDKEK
jgi:post-segregation antitoxin (ccd killing protein)